MACLIDQSFQNPEGKKVNKGVVKFFKIVNKALFDPLLTMGKVNHQERNSASKYTMKIYVNTLIDLFDSPLAPWIFALSSNPVFLCIGVVNKVNDKK